MNSSSTLIIIPAKKNELLHYNSLYAEDWDRPLQQMDQTSSTLWNPSHKLESFTDLLFHGQKEMLSCALNHDLPNLVQDHTQQSIPL